MKKYNLLQERNNDECGSNGVWDLAYEMAYDIMKVAKVFENANNISSIARNK